MFLLVGGGGFAYWSHKQNLPAPIWIPIPMKHELSVEQREKIAEQLEEKLETPEILNKITQDLNLAAKWKLSYPDATAELKKRLFVRTGEMDGPSGKAPSMDVGVNGPRKDSAITHEIAKRVMDDVLDLLGIKSLQER